MYQRVKGTQDFLDMTLFNFFIEQAKKHLALYHFSEIMTPILEPTELFKRSLGMQTDVVSKEMFIVKTKDEDDGICLRPEATASTVRAFVENHVQTTPWKVFSYGPMFRYERPQKGRYRQFHQLTMEIIGAASISQDALFIAMLDRLFSEKLKLDTYALIINFVGCFDDRKAYRVLLQEFLDSGTPYQLCKTCLHRKETNILRIFDCKEPECQKIYKDAPILINNLCKPCAQEWQQLQDELELLSVSYTINPTLVRGLDYYNKTVFEFISTNLGAQNAFCGGGRYDQLVGQVGGHEDQPSIGAAIGIERILLLLEPIKEKLPIASSPALHIIMPLAQEQQGVALLLADELHAHNICTDVLFQGSIKNMMRKANKFGAAYTIIIGDDEQKNNQVTVKNMITGAEERIAQDELVDFLKK